MSRTQSKIDPVKAQVAIATEKINARRKAALLTAPQEEGKTQAIINVVRGKGSPSLADDIAADAGVKADPKAALDRVTALVELMRHAEDNVAAAEAALKKEKAKLAKIETEDLPELMKESGLLTLTLLDGTKVKIDEEVSCGISAENAEEAHAWLRKNNFGGVIKTAVIEMFGKDEMEKADKLYLEMVKKYGADSTILKETVHPQTLKALIKEIMAKNDKKLKLPLKLFSVFPYSKAKITVPKAKS